MTGLLDRLKKGADKAALEADKLRRITRVRSQISALQGRVNSHTRALGEKALGLFDAGQLTQPELLEGCEQIAVLRQQMAEKEAEIEAIRQETLPEEPESVLCGHICPNCKIRLADEAHFCPECGSIAQDVPPPAPPEVSIRLVCGSCGVPLVQGAAFCPECGTKVEAPSPAPAQVCANCGVSLIEGAAFCPECGTHVEIAKPVSAVEESANGQEEIDEIAESQ
jgi:RNA polymerase subunit RPABC4/transcription elongation factor Spt4